jgi:hypothetical protein
MRFFLSVLLLPGLLSAALLPDAVPPWHKSGAGVPVLADRPVWDEYGFKEAETGTYQNGSAKFTLTAWRLQDPTGALAAFEWQRPAHARASKLATLAAETRGGLIWVHGQYVLSADGHQPTAEEIGAIGQALKNVDTTALPALPGYLPAENLVPNSERYVTGAAGLAKFDPAIAPSLAGFHLGAEAQLGVFRGPKGDMVMAVFNYPTPQIAMQKFGDFEKAGEMARRSGPLVAVFATPADPDLAERLLGQVRYQAEITRDEYVPTKRDNMGDLLINICILIGITAAFALVSGLLWGGLRTLRRLLRRGPEPEPMITLHLE